MAARSDPFFAQPKSSFRHLMLVRRVVNLPGVLRSFRASFACLVSNEMLTGRSSGEKAPLIVSDGDAEPGDRWFDITEPVMD